MIWLVGRGDESRILYPGHRTRKVIWPPDRISIRLACIYLFSDVNKLFSGVSIRDIWELR